MSRSGINEETSEFGVGPLNLDVKMARRHGWSEEAIEYVAKLIGDVSQREATVSHWAGPVKGCPCISCDLAVPLDELDDGNLLDRSRWASFEEKSNRSEGN